MAEIPALEGLVAGRPEAAVPGALRAWLGRVYRLDGVSLGRLVDALLGAIEAARAVGDGPLALARTQALARALTVPEGREQEGHEARVEQALRAQKAARRLRIETAAGEWERARELLVASPERAELIHTFHATPPPQPREGHDEALLIRLGARPALEVDELRALLQGEGLLPGTLARVALARYVALSALATPALREHLALDRTAWVPDALGATHRPAELFWPAPGLEALLGEAPGLRPHPLLSRTVPAALAAWLVRRVAPAAAGSGIPRVIAVLEGSLPPAPTSVIPVKFVAGTLAIGSGLALGREGPTVQMGASLAYRIGTLSGRRWSDGRALMAAGAGAGFAVAFNAPIAGALFVFEALVKRFEARIALAAVAACALATGVGRAISGNAAELKVPTLSAPGLLGLPLFVGLGLAAGLAGVFYNRTLLGALRLTDRLPGLPVEGRAGIVGAAVGAIAWFAPSLVGGGEGLAQQALSGQGTLAVLTLSFLFRLCLIACSVAAGAPGGLLVPFLALGAELGLAFGLLATLALPGLALQAEGFAVVGMAALFTAIVRAPLTAVVLVTEMTTDTTMLLPMILACAAAMLVPALFGDRSILESLVARLLGRSPRAAQDVGRAAVGR
ncbi:MAG TPA: ClC family H(+)/Cl(-) exchange transporter [Burkholderiaceae bacterium]|nr:ClC family H(+)/Cl(-) exchange transporter [Burkholderiaceae bacterium]